MTNLRNNNREIVHRISRKCKQFFLDSTNSFEKRSFWYSILLHLLLVAALVIVGTYLQTRYNEPEMTLTLNKQQHQTPIINAEVISNNAVKNTYKPIKPIQQKLTEQQQNQLNAIEQKIARAKQLALKEFDAINLAEQKKQETLKKQAEIEKQKKHKAEQEALLKKEQLQQEKEAQLAKEQALEKERQEHEKVMQKERALKALQQSVLSDLDRQNQTALEKTKTQKVLESYAAEYKRRIESAWVMDDCHKINTKQLPTVLVIPSQAPSVVVSSGNSECDHALLLAFRNTQAPNLPADAEAQKVIQQGINFQFGALAR